MTDLGIQHGACTSASPAMEKVRLFRSFFRGRTDVFPKLWINQKKATKGYAPACAHEWKPGICEKPKVKCGECPHQAFIAVDDQVVLDHLQGRHVIGVYPLLGDETCWFLAADFDKKSWQDDVSAFSETCSGLGIPSAIERSRSGNGAHVWFFFSSPVAASAARKMGCFLITETMSRRHQLSMESYDRFFPNQDTMPRGGFGNLIALPLQHGPRQQGNSLFVDPAFNPYPDQWSFLSAIPRMDPARVDAIAQEAASHDRVVGIAYTDPIDEEESAKPWTRLPSRKPKPIPITGTLPEKIRSVLAQRLFVEKDGLPSPLINRIKRLAAFQNPEFYKKEKLRLSTALTPRVITCAEDLPNHIALPRGCLSDLRELLESLKIRLEVTDQRNAGVPCNFRFCGKLSSAQNFAAEAIVAHETGVLVAPPGVGKTVLGAYFVAKRSCSTLIIVHRTALLDQWIAQLSIFLEIKSSDIGQIGGGKRKPNGRLDVAMIHALVQKDGVDNIVHNYGHVIVDECHHLPAISFERVLAEAKARFFLGLTATPQRRDGHHPITGMQLGPVRFTVDPKSEAARRGMDHRLIVRETSFRADGFSPKSGIQDLYNSLSADQARNQLILNDVTDALQQGRSPILLTERKDQLEFFAGRLEKPGRHVVVLKGGTSGKERKRIAKLLTMIPVDEERIILATGRYVGEGFDDSRLDTLFLALPIAWKGTIVQYTGRLHRNGPRKTDVKVYDYVDREIPVLRKMFDKRLRTYLALGYHRGDTPSLFVKNEVVLDAQINSKSQSVELNPHEVIPFNLKTGKAPISKVSGKVGRRGKRLNLAHLDSLIDEATIDCFNASEQVACLFDMINERLEVPFETQVLGVDVDVERIALTDDESIVAICARGGERQEIAILKLPLPMPPPIGAECIEAYRTWARGRN